MRRLLKQILRISLALVLLFYGFCLLGMLFVKFLPPPITAVQVQRRIEALVSGKPYQRHYRYVPLNRISNHLEHAVVAAEDARFRQHHGFDWTELQQARRTAERRGRSPRGASTLTQQLVKNLFLSTHRSYVRKGVEYTLTPLAELILSKDRMLELYLNVVEWGPGVWGAQEAAEYHYGVPAAQLSRDQAARLAAILPAPRVRNPARMGRYSQIIKGRMAQMGW